MSNCCKENKDKCCGISKVVIPAALGDENGEYGPQNGAYSNTLVEYQASGVSYLYSNDGIPTRMGDGIVATIEVGETTTLQPGESATVENTGDKYHAVLNFGIPEGQKGDTGDAATVEVGATTTSAPGSDASVTNSGDEHNAVLDFVIPRGSQGPQGVPGQAATIQVGTVTTLDPDQDATVVNSGTTSAAVFDFGIPKGDKGDTGSVSSEVVTELPVPGDDSKLYLMEKNPTIETESGAEFTIENAATDGEMKLTEIDGNATQTTYSGKNKLPMVDGTATIRGITATIADGVLTLNGTSTGSGILKLTNGVEGTESLSPSEAWLTETFPITNLNGTNIAIDYQSGTSPQASSAFRLYGSTTTYINQWYPLTSDQATVWSSDTPAPSCLCFFFGNGITFSNYKITLQIESGSTATSFEKYVGGTASPNPDYPQPISVVTGENVVKIEGKNLFDGVLEEGIINGNTGEDAYIAGYIRDKNYILVQEQSTYILSSPDFSGSYAVYEYKADKSYNLTTNKITATGAFTTNAGTKYVRFRPSATGLTTSARFQLELGSTATDYEPYQGQEFEVNLGSIELAKIGDYQDRIYKEDSKWYIEKKVGKVVLDGSENWSSSGQTNGFVCVYSQSGSPFYGKLALGNPSYQSMCDHFEFQPNGTTWTGLGKCGFNSAGAFWLQNTQPGDIIAWLASNPTTVYYALATPTTTEITNEALLSQLNFIANLYGGTNNIMLVGTGAQGEIAVEYQTWDKYNRYDVYIWNDEINDYQILNS